jgi:hypothetical protein
MPSNNPEYMRQWRAKNKDKVREYQVRWTNSESGKVFVRTRHERTVGTVQGKARKKISNRIYRKKMPHPSFFLCTDCDARAAHYHHEDYSLWWSVEPLCHACHGKRHRIY